MSATAETVDLVEVAGSVRREWPRILAGLAVGLVAALAVLWLAPRQFRATASVLLRSDADNSTSLLSRFALAGGPADLASLPGALKGSMDTEVQLLESRSLVGEVVDSLGLQARVVKPAGIAADRIVRPATYPGSFAPVEYTFERRAGTPGYSVDGAGPAAAATPGNPVRLGPAIVTLRSGPLPDRFTLRIEDREDAIDRVLKQLRVDKPGGEVASIAFKAGDSVTAAAVPNALIADYLLSRRTTDRGVNQHRLEFLAAHADTVQLQLAEAERRLRQYEESSGVVDPELLGRLGLEQVVGLRRQRDSISVEERALGQMLADVASGRMEPRRLAAYPTFLRSQAINDYLSQIANLETERLRMLERRTEKDAEVLALQQSIEHLESQLAPLARGYAAVLDSQRTAADRQLATITATLGALPGETEAFVRLKREVTRLGQTAVALQTQLIDARLAAISEGGRVRQVDVAEPPRKVAFPRPLPTIAVGLAAGLLVGIVLAIQGAYLGSRVRDPDDVERMAGVPAVTLRDAAPFFFVRQNGYRSVLVVPLGTGARPEEVARQILATACARGEDAQLVEGGATDLSPTALRQAVQAAEARSAFAISVLPRLADARTAALFDHSRPVLFVAQAGALTRSELRNAAETLRRASIPSLGVVLQPRPHSNGVVRA